ncbi:c-type cytochrome domain-containing protein [Allorhodopirellula heiligendammensis]|uniref:WD domain, G-beta repeat n=1 Tax=Allorhodopirellula heiligendammensis TaxID=2714739 RepID=A0A5C6C144_9BACT|nr:c-type cytochrome domain-containing protein [Allorhodopirellula heiligendammensis]TWU16569.1 WD domain, G-beta repeat [Allorhodopirellula heiligendammensis]
MNLSRLLVVGSFGLTLMSAPLVLAAPADDAAAAKKVTYDDDIKPIFRQHCLTCHNQSDKRGGLAIDSYGALLEGGGSGEVVYDDGDPEASRLWQLVNHDDTPVMPPEQPKIAAEQLATLKAWIEGGILENSGSTAKAKKKNSLAFVAPSSGKPEGPPPMPATLPQKVPVVTERAAAITAIGASPWAPLIAVAGQKQIALYHGETAELLGILPFEEGVAQSLRFSRDGRFLIAGGGAHSVLGIAAVYEIETGNRVASVGDELDIVFDADCNDDMSRIALGGPQKMLRIFDATDGTLLFDLKKHTDWIYAVAFSPDGVLVASADRAGGLVVWEASTGRQFLDLTDHKGAVNSISWRDDSNVLASASDDGTVKLWDMVQGKAIKSINVGGGPVTAVRFDHKGQLVTASNDHRVRLFDASGNKTKEFPPMAEAALEAAITHDSSRVVYGDWTGTVQLTTVADPPVATPLAANPPPAAKRLEAVEATLASIRTKLEPLAAAQQAAKASLDTAQQQLKDAEAAQAAAVAAVQQSQAKEAALRQQSQQLGEKLPTMILSSRDQHDAVIAARIGLGDAVDPAKIESVAVAETKLATLMTEIANTRREAIDAVNKADAEKTAATELAAKIKPAEELVQQRRSEVGAATTAYEQAQQAHDAVAAEMTEQDRKKQALAAAVQ